MNALRRNVLKSAAGAGTVAVAVAAGLLKPTLAMAGAPRSAFEAKNVGDALKGMGASAPADSKDITIKAPDIAENGAVVPVEVTSNIAGTTGIAIMAEKNATPLIADFDLIGRRPGFYLHPNQNGANLAGSCRCHGWRQVLHRGQGSQSHHWRLRRLIAAVIAIQLADLNHFLGKESQMAEPMRIRATMAGDVADVKVLMNHPWKPVCVKTPRPVK